MLFKNKKALFFQFLLSLSLLSLAPILFSASADKKRKEAPAPFEDGYESPEEKIEKIPKKSIQITPSKQLALSLEGTSLVDKSPVKRLKTEVSAQPVAASGSAASPKSPKSDQDIEASTLKGLQERNAKLDSTNKILMASLLFFEGFFVDLSNSPAPTCLPICQFSSALALKDEPKLFLSLIPLEIIDSEKFIYLSVTAESAPKINRIKLFKICCDYSDKMEQEEKKNFFELCKSLALGYEEFFLFSNLKEKLQGPSRGRKSPTSDSSGGRTSPGSESSESELSSAKKKKEVHPFQQFAPLARSFYAQEGICSSSVMNAGGEKFIQTLNKQLFSRHKDCSSSLLFNSNIVKKCLDDLSNADIQAGGAENPTYLFSLMNQYFNIPGFIFDRREELIEEGLFKRILFEGSTSYIVPSLKTTSLQEIFALSDFQKYNSFVKDSLDINNLLLLFDSMQSLPEKLGRKKITAIEKEISIILKKIEKNPQEALSKQRKELEDTLLTLTYKSPKDRSALELKEKSFRLKGPLYELSVAHKLAYILKESIVFFGEKIGTPLFDYDVSTNSFCIEAKNRNYNSQDKAAATEESTGQEAWIHDKKSFISHKESLNKVDNRNYFVVFGGTPPDEGYAQSLGSIDIPWIHLPAEQSFDQFKIDLENRKLEMSAGFMAWVEDMKQQAPSSTAAAAGFSSAIPMQDYLPEPLPRRLSQAWPIGTDRAMAASAETAAASAAP